MSESLFKFKKTEIKKVGEFDVNEKYEWCMLRKSQYQDVTVFMHFHKLWNVVEVPEVVDADGTVTTQAIKAQPAFEYNTGFLKDDKFIVTGRKTVHDQTFHGIHKKFINALANGLQDGYKKDWSCYKLDIPQPPSYYHNEKTSENEIMKQQIVNFQRNQGTTNSGNIPVGSPIIPKKKKVFPHLKLVVPTTPNSNNP